MKLTLIGTGAGEAYPGFWCSCENCSRARMTGGKDLRGNCTALLNDDLLLDMNHHFFEMAPRLGIWPDRLRHLLVTHPHQDHFTPYLLGQRAMDPAYAELPVRERHARISPCFTALPMLDVYGNACVEAALADVPGLMEKAEVCRFAFHRIEAGVSFEMGNYRVTPVRSRHTDIPDYTLNYIIGQEGRRLLYATDTGGYDPDMLPLILACRYDAVVVEGTFGLGLSVEGHMSLEKDRAFRTLLLKNGCITEDTPVVLTHLCPHWTPPHAEYAPLVEASGMLLGYDGMTLKI